MKDEDMQTFANETVNVIQHMGNDVVRLQMLVDNLLEDLGKLNKISCPSCEEEILRPEVKGIPLQDICPSCQSSLLDGEQTSFEDWDNGAEDESE